MTIFLSFFAFSGDVFDDHFALFIEAVRKTYFHNIVHEMSFHSMFPNQRSVVKIVAVEQMGC